jgi:hypothetical protein
MKIFTYGPRSNRIMVLIPPRKTNSNNDLPYVEPLNLATSTNSTLLIEGTIQPIRCLGPGLYGIPKDEGLELAQWLQDNLDFDDDIRHASVWFIEMIELPEIDLLDLATLVDNIITDDAFHLEIDGNQGDNWGVLVEEGEAIKDLPRSLSPDR